MVSDVKHNIEKIVKMCNIVNWMQSATDLYSYTPLEKYMCTKFKVFIARCMNVCNVCRIIRNGLASRIYSNWKKKLNEFEGE